VWQFRQILAPEDGHIGPKHVVLSEREGEKLKKKKNCCITDGIDIQILFNLNNISEGSWSQI
jgi:hypothetical protein